MGRAPWCEKMGLKKGPWTPEEDLILINHVNTHGHKNWRALPKQAGLLRWSAIAARLPGRTDNEIKNVWHTRLKKKQMQSALALDAQKQEQKLPVNFPTHHHVNVIKAEMPPPSSQQCSSSDMSTLTTSDNNEHNSHSFINNHGHMSLNNSAESLDDDFWSQVLSADNSNETKSGFPAGLKNPFSPLLTEEGVHLATSSSLCDSIDLIFGSMIRYIDGSHES